MSTPFSHPAPNDHESRSDRALAALEARERVERFAEYMSHPLRTPDALRAFVAAPVLPVAKTAPIELWQLATEFMRDQQEFR